MRKIYIYLLTIIFFGLMPAVAKADCNPGDSCGSCTSQTCSDGNACATGHTYCVWDANGNYCGSCSTELNNCTSQCSSGSGDGDGGGTTYYDCGTYQGLPYRCTNQACTQGCITIRPSENNCTIQTNICSNSSPGPCPPGQTGTVICNTGTGNCETNCTATGCSYSACGGNNCSSNQRYISGSGNNCPSGYTGAGCYIDTSCGTSSTPTPTPTPCPTVGSSSTLSPSGTIAAGTQALTWTNVTNATLYHARVNDETTGSTFDATGCTNGTNYGTTQTTDLCTGDVISGTVSYNFQAGRTYSFWIDAYNSCGNVSYPSTTVTVPPNCNATPVCSGSCNATDNYCPQSSGTKSGCVYTAYSGGGSCTQVAAPDQSCTKTYTCSSGYVCVSGSCRANYDAWIQVTGDIHSQTKIDLPAGP